MGLKSRNKVNASFSMSSMTDIVFLLLIFFMVTSTLIHPNALKLLLPKSSNQTAAKPLTTVSITSDLQYAIEGKTVSYSSLESELVKKVGNEDDVYVSLHADKSVAIEHVVNVMNIAKKHKYKMILATEKE